MKEDKTIDKCVGNSGMFAKFNDRFDYCSLEGDCKYMSNAHIEIKEQLFPVCRLRTKERKNEYQR